MPKVSIIIAVYKAEDYFERCLDTLFQQTFTDIEYIFVNDASPDTSMDILNRVSHKYSGRNIRIINHTTNQGVASARNHAINIATGDYIISVDPDDWIDLDMIESMYNFAIVNNSDVVICDFINEYQNRSEAFSYNLKTNVSSLTDSLMMGNMHGYLWNKLIKRSILTENNINTIEGVNMCEDLMIMLKVGMYSKNVHYLPKQFYHYDQHSNPNSLRINKGGG
ncbi:MAG: glycosyltransferase [Bacteroides sp.]|nr:glycosyltransferase [Bacteroides sp.]MCM1413266.1 glycosyltransferase [Bacteroides sp.]MCM1471424.1 glycosyltransferase [Bacteroides sp.]